MNASVQAIHCPLGNTLGGMNSKCEVHQAKYSDFIDVMYDLTCPGFMLVTLFESLYLCAKSSELNQTRRKDGKKIRKHIDITFITMIHSIAKLLKKSTLVLKNPRTMTVKIGVETSM